MLNAVRRRCPVRERRRGTRQQQHRGGRSDGEQEKGGKFGKKLLLQLLGRPSGK